jgi:hypothetical protein
MQLLESRLVDSLDTQSLTEMRTREALFRDDREGFILYLTRDAGSNGGEERVVFLELREALLWLNESNQDYSLYWE